MLSAQLESPTEVFLTCNSLQDWELQFANTEWFQTVLGTRQVDSSQQSLLHIENLQETTGIIQDVRGFLKQDCSRATTLVRRFLLAGTGISQVSEALGVGLLSGAGREKGIL